MLATDVKIAGLKRQKDFLKKCLKKLQESPRINGDSLIVYKGHLYPETIAYLMAEGCSVTKYNSDVILASTGGYPIYNICVDNIRLSASEQTKADTVNTSLNTHEFNELLNRSLNVEEEVDELLRNL